MKRTKHNKNGFTLIELMIVVAMVGILAALAIPACMGYNKVSEQIEERARTSWDCSEVAQDDLITYEKACMADNGPNYCQQAAKERLCQKVVSHPDSSSGPT